jgi:hypothetical protein
MITLNNQNLKRMRSAQDSSEFIIEDQCMVCSLEGEVWDHS